MLTDDVRAACVLVIDHEPALREMVREILSGAGFRVIEAAAPGAAMELARLDVPDVVLLDLRVPGPADRKHLDRLRGISASLRVVVMSGSATEEEVRELGADRLLEKPYRAAELLDCVRATLADPPDRI